MTPLSLAADFPDQDEARWRALAEAALKGAPWDRLVSRAPGGIAVRPLYREPDCATAQDEPGLPGQAPFTRGGRATRDPFMPWDIRQPIGQPDAAAANRDALADFEGGVSSIELLVSGRSRPGLAAEGIPTALAGVLLDLAPVALNAGTAGIAAAETLLQHYRDRGADPARAQPILNLDPLSAWMADGGLDQPFEVAADAAAAAARAVKAAWPRAFGLRASGRAAHEAGAAAPLELAVMLASGVAHLRALERQGWDPTRAGEMILFALAAGPDVILETAKLRAARGLWAQVMDAVGARGEGCTMTLHAVTSRRMVTRYDAWTNILRTTAASFAAAVGGADAITTLPMTAALGEATPQARRLARNTQVILMEECRLGHVMDPGGGAWAVEKLTRDIAEAAWRAFQTIEAGGGVGAALRAGALQKLIAADRAEADLAAARRLRPITGLSDFPLLDETPPAVAAGDPAAAQRAPESDRIEPLPWVRLSEPFERLRDKATAANPVFFANLGPLAEFSPRANFARNLFAAGGVGAEAPETAYADIAAMAAAFAASGLKVCVLTGSDTRYAAESLAAASALKAAGCTWLIHAGKPADEAAVRAKGFDQFVYAGQNALEALETLHAALGVKP